MADLRVFYRRMVDNHTLRGVEEASGVGHETLRKLVMTEEEWRALRGAHARPYQPQKATLLDLEAFYWDHHTQPQAGPVVREDPDAALPANPAAAMRAFFPADAGRAEAAIERIEALLEGAEPPPVSPRRMGELLRMLYEQGRDVTVRYPRKRRARGARPPAPGDAESPESPESPEPPPERDAPGE